MLLEPLHLRRGSRAAGDRSGRGSARRSGHTQFRAVLTTVVVSATVLGPVAGARATSPVPGAPQWATPAEATIHPGIVTQTKDGACTANFVFLDGARHTYIGQAAHCSGLGEANDINGCTAESLPLGTPVRLGGSMIDGTLAYNSWLTMQQIHEKRDYVCASNDFALIRIPDSALSEVNPSIPIFGGPIGLRSSPLGPGAAVLSYGNSPLRGGITVLSPKQGFNVADDPSGWAHTVYTLSPGVPGDSGSAFLDSNGEAFGVLSTLAFAPLTGSNGVADLAKCLDYAEEHSRIKGLRLVVGTASFRPGPVPALGGITGGISHGRAGAPLH